MSWKVLAKVYERKAGSAMNKAILSYCADKASDNGRGIWASKGTIAAELEAGRSTVIRVMNELVEEGLLVPEGTRGCANGATVEYRIDLAALARLPLVEKPNTRSSNQSQSETGPDKDQSQSETSPRASENQSQSGTQTSLEPPLGEGTRARDADRFEEFWDAYPHRGGNKRKRKDAEVKWRTLRKAGVSQQEMIDGARRAHGDADVLRGYARDPTSWLNQEGWKDEIDQSPQTPSTTTNGRRHDRASEHRAFDDTLRETTRRLRAGEIDFGPDSSDPFAGG